MSDSKKAPRKRKLVSNQSSSNRAEQNTGNTMDQPSTSAAVTIPVSDAVTTEEPRRQKKMYYAKRRREYENLVDTVAIENNCQHDLRTRRELASLQAENDSSDEPSPRRRRLNPENSLLENQGDETEDPIPEVNDPQSTTEESLQDNPSSSSELPLVHSPEPHDPTSMLNANHVSENQPSPLHIFYGNDDITGTSSEDEDYSEIIDNIRNCYITNQYERYRRSSMLAHNTSDTRASSWINQRRRFGTSGRGLPYHSVLSSPFELARQQVHPVSYNYVYYGNTPTYYPLTETPGFDFDDDYFDYLVSLQVPPRADSASEHQRRWDAIPNGPQQGLRQPFSDPRRSSYIRVARRGVSRSASSQNIRLPNTSQIVPDEETNNSQNMTQTEAQDVNSSASQQPLEAGSQTNSNSGPPVILSVLGCCPICRCPLTQKNVVTTYCGHLFCRKCIRKAIMINGRNCPLCRQFLKGRCYHSLYF